MTHRAQVEHCTSEPLLSPSNSSNVHAQLSNWVRSEPAEYLNNTEGSGETAKEAMVTGIWACYLVPVLIKMSHSQLKCLLCDLFMYFVSL